jgi:phosphoglycerate dehydrogenase-like enzyme
MTRPCVAVLARLPDGLFEQLARDLPAFDWRDARSPAGLDQHLGGAAITYGLPPVERLGEATGLKWVQLISAGVPPELCPPAKERGIAVTNLAGLYGPSIAEHAFALLTFLARNFHAAFRNQLRGAWDRSVAGKLADLRGKTLAVIGLGDIGRSVARLGRAYGLRVVGCRRRPERPAPEADEVYPLARLREMLAEADYIVVAAPLTSATEGLLGPAEFAAMKRGAILVNVSRGPVVQEPALLEALRGGQLSAAGLDVYAAEPLPAGHPLWSMPQVVLIPHVAGEAINQSSRPAERFRRNLANWQAGRPLEGLVDLDQGY